MIKHKKSTQCQKGQTIPNTVGQYRKVHRFENFNYCANQSNGASLAVQSICHIEPYKTGNLVNVTYEHSTKTRLSFSGGPQGPVNMADSMENVNVGEKSCLLFYKLLLTLIIATHGNQFAQNAARSAIFYPVRSVVIKLLLQLFSNIVIQLGIVVNYLRF